MSLSPRQQDELHVIEIDILRSDPQLAAMLGVFVRLWAGKGMPAWEQMSSREDHIRQPAALIVETLTIVAAAIRRLLSAVLLAHDRKVPRQGGHGG
jgi:hypothetical protein